MFSMTLITEDQIIVANGGGALWIVQFRDAFSGIGHTCPMDAVSFAAMVGRLLNPDCELPTPSHLHDADLLLKETGCPKECYPSA